MYPTTLQGLFDQAVGGVLKQGGPGIDSTGFPTTVNRHERRCALGHLAPEGLERTQNFGDEAPQFELDAILRHAIKTVPGCEALLQDLQGAHDGGWREARKCDAPMTAFMANFRHRAEKIAAKHHLDPCILRGAS